MEKIKEYPEEVISINKNDKTVHFDNNTFITTSDFMKQFQIFLHNRCAGETITPVDTEHFMSRTSSKNMKLLMKGKKMEGFQEGMMGKPLTRGMKIAIGTIFIIVIILIIVYVTLHGQGVI